MKTTMMVIYQCILYNSLEIKISYVPKSRINCLLCLII
jgi:hypothetical protein